MYSVLDVNNNCKQIFEFSIICQNAIFKVSKM
jgi:hypothetical protein